MNTYYVVKLLTNTQEQDGSSIAAFNRETDKEAKTAAFIEYHRTLASYHNAPDVLFAVVQVKNFEGTVVATEIVDHIPEPTPEPEPEPEPEEPVEE